MNLESLEKFLPRAALPHVERWLEDVHILIKIKNSRRTKLGDYRFNHSFKQHQITIDRELSPEAFFFVLTHEIAHLKVHKLFGSKAKSHGVEWKTIFGNMLLESVKIYSEKTKSSIFNHARNPRASVGADKYLFQQLFVDENQREKLVENIGENQKFRIGKRVFQRGSKRKIRYLCKELNTGRLYLVNGQAIVDEIISE